MLLKGATEPFFTKPVNYTKQEGFGALNGTLLPLGTSHRILFSKNVLPKKILTFQNIYKNPEKGGSLFENIIPSKDRIENQP